MSNFQRAIAMSLRHKWLLIASMLSAIMVALFWGANISVVFPFAEVAFQGRTLQEWVSRDIQDAEKKLDYFSRLSEILQRYESAGPEKAPALVTEDLKKYAQERANKKLAQAEHISLIVSNFEATSGTPSPELAGELQSLVVDSADSDDLIRGLGPTYPGIIDHLEGYQPLDGKSLIARARYDLQTAKDRLAAERTALRLRRLLKPYIDRYLPRDPFKTLLLVVAFLVVGTLIKATFLVVNSLVVDRISQTVVLELRNQFFRRTLRLDLACFTERGANELISRFTADFESLGHGLQNLLGKAVREPLKMVVCLGVAAVICWRLLLLSLFIAPLAAYLMRALSRSLKRANRRAMDEMSLLYGMLAETFQGIKMVKAFTMERYEQRRFREVTRTFFRKQMRIAYYDALIRPVSELLGICIISMAIIFGAYLVLNQQTHILGIRMSERPMTLPSLMLFFSMLAGVSDPARKLAEIFAWVQRASAASDRIFNAMDREASIQDPPKPVMLPHPHRTLEFQNISFGYTPDKLVLRGVNLKIPFGEALAIVGPNGCGKSTLTNLVPRFFDPTEGQVMLDGVDIRQARISELRGRIGLVAQESLLFEDTVLNNIRYGSPFASHDDVVRAAKRAHAHEFITGQLERGYETMVGAGGGRLSGGQRQRIALARAILRDPEILILDEATSQIDIKSERLIHGVLEEFLRGRTALIITHRIETLCLANRILVMDAGRIVDLGTHEELLGRCEAYRRMYNMELRESA